MDNVNGTGNGMSSDLHRQRAPMKANPPKPSHAVGNGNMRSMNSDKDDEKAIAPPTYHAPSRHTVPPRTQPPTYYSNGNSRDTTSNAVNTVNRDTMNGGNMMSGTQRASHGDIGDNNAMSMTQSDRDHAMTRKVASNVNVEETFYEEEYSTISPQQNVHSTNAMNMDTAQPVQQQHVAMNTMNTASPEMSHAVNGRNQRNPMPMETERVTANPMNPVPVETANAVNAMNHAAVPPHRAVQAQPVQNRNIHGQSTRMDHAQRVESVNVPKPTTFDQTPIKQHEQPPPVQQQPVVKPQPVAAASTKKVNPVPPQPKAPPVVQNDYGDFIASSFVYERPQYQEKAKVVEPVMTEDQIRERRKLKKKQKKKEKAERERQWVVTFVDEQLRTPAVQEVMGGLRVNEKRAMQLIRGYHVTMRREWIVSFVGHRGRVPTVNEVINALRVDEQKAITLITNYNNSRGQFTTQPMSTAQPVNVMTAPTNGQQSGYPMYSEQSKPLNTYDAPNSYDPPNTGNTTTVTSNGIDTGFDDGIDFDIGDQHANDCHAEIQEYKAQELARERVVKEKEDLKYTQIATLIKPKDGSYEWNYEYDEERLRQWESFVDQHLKDERQIHTSTMLTFSGIDGLEDKKEDKKRLKKVLINDLGFREEQIVETHIRKDRFWCIIYVRAPRSIIQKIQKKLKKKNQNDARKQIRPRNFYQLPAEEKAKYPPLYTLRDFDRRPRADQIDKDLQSELENGKLYILNFDVTRKTHKLLTMLFLKYGDLNSDIRIALNWMGDPYAIVDYREPEVAMALFEYQNRSGAPDKKIKFGGRTLSIQLSKIKQTA